MLEEDGLLFPKEFRLPLQLVDHSGLRLFRGFGGPGFALVRGFGHGSARARAAVEPPGLKLPENCTARRHGGQGSPALLYSVSFQPKAVGR